MTVAPEVSLVCRFHAAAAEAPTLFYCHGGGESCATFNDEAGNFVRHGINVFLASYRGYGLSSGAPSVSAMLLDGRSLFGQASEWLAGHGFTGPLFVMGRSLGSVCAIDIAHKFDDKIKGLCLESGYAETAPVLEALGVQSAAIPPLEDAGFDNLGKITAIKLPTLIFHGAKDTVVPVVQAEKLQASAGARNKQFYLVPGAAHDTVSKTGGELYYQKIKEFIDSVCGLNTWRQRRRENKGRSGGRS
jgi:alpha-beta hydrolase superfamily lysophospholipase